MKIDLSKLLNKITNSQIGIVFIIIIPTIFTYIGFFEVHTINVISNKMELAISIFIGVDCYLILKIFDIQNKLISLKKFRDFESLSTINFFNTEIKKLNDRLLEVESKLEIKTTSQLTENEKRLFQEEKRLKDEKIIEYNEIFFAIGCGNYGVGINTSHFKKLNYE